jgi:hypothetical protein
MKSAEKNTYRGHPAAYCLMRLAIGVSKLSGAVAVVLFVMSLLKSSILVPCFIFLVLTLLSFFFSCGIILIFILQYSLRAMIGTFLAANGLIALVLSRHALLSMLGFAGLLTLAYILTIEVVSFDPDFKEPDVASSDVRYLLDSINNTRPNLVTGLVLSGCCVLALRLIFASASSAIEIEIGIVCLIALLVLVSIGIVRANVLILKEKATIKSETHGTGADTRN